MGGRKRKRQGTPNLDTLRSIYGEDAHIIALPKFIGRIAPALKVDWKDQDQLSNTFVVPYAPKALQPIPRLSKPSISCSLSDLIDHVIWVLVRRRSKDWHQWNNVLATGYKISSSHHNHMHCPNLPPGVASTNINDNVSYCKTSSLIGTLHRLVGEEVLRVLLLYTSVLLPIKESNSNFMLLCGPFPRRSAPTLLRQQTKRSNKPSKKQKPSLEPNACIPRFTMFYSDSYTPKVNLPSSHIFQKHSPVELLKAIFPQQSQRCTPNRIEIARLILRNHEKCDYHRLLDRYCPLPDFVSWEQQSNSKNKLDIAQAAAAFSPVQGVVCLVQTVVKQVFPQPVWGSEHNLDIVLANVATFLALRRQERFPNKALMKGMRVTQMNWLWKNKERRQQRADHQHANEMLLFVLRWIFLRFIIPLLRCCFYVTETEFSAKQVLYYRKPVWSIFRSLSMQKLLREGGQYQEMTKSEAIQREQTQRTGFSKLKLVPKATGVRPVAMLSKRENVAEGSRQFKSTNAVLCDVFNCLNYEYNRDPTSFGAGLFGLNQVYPVYKRLVEELHSHGEQMNGFAPKTPQSLYFVSVDIRHCYDNIHQEYLLKLVREMLSEEEYLIQHHSVLHPFKSMDKTVWKPLRKVGPIGTYQPFAREASARSDKYNNSLFVDMGGTGIVQKREVEGLLEEHLTSNLVSTNGRYGNRYMLQRKGIPQGSVLSTMLCNFYYGEVENQILSGAAVPFGGLEVTPTRKGVLLRIVDDFLLITTDQKAARQFVALMDKGQPELGAEINRDKTLCSFDLDQELSPAIEAEKAKTSLPVFAGTTYFSWCGLLFSTQTGEVRLDYSRFAHGIAENSITVDRVREGNRLDVRIKGFMRQRCQPILFDRKINNYERIVSNFFEAMMMCAVKTDEYTHSAMELHKNVRFFLGCIQQVITYSRKIIVDRLKKQGGFEGTFCISERECKWLGFHAFCVVFRPRPRSVLAALQRVCATIKVKKKLCTIASRAQKEFEHALGLSFLDTPTKDSSS